MEHTERNTTSGWREKRASWTNPWRLLLLDTPTVLRTIVVVIAAMLSYLILGVKGVASPPQLGDP